MPEQTRRQPTQRAPAVRGKKQTTPKVQSALERAAQWRSLSAADQNQHHAEVVEQLRDALEELQVAEEELRLQNEELAAAQEELRAEHQRYVDLFEFAPDGYLVTDAAGLIREANRAAAALLLGGHEPEYLQGKPLVVYVVEPARKTFRNELNSAARATQVFEWEQWFQPQAGAAFPAIVRVGAVRDAHGHVTGLRWLIRDISAHKRAEHALRQSEKELRLITDNVPALIGYVDSGQRYRFNNRAYSAWFGYTRAELYGKEVREVLGEAAYAAIKPHMERALSGHAVTFEAYLPLKHAGRRYVNASYVPDFGETGEVNGFYVLIADATERKKAEDAVRESEMRFRRMADTAPVLMWMADEEKQCVYFNKQWFDFTGRTLEQELGFGWAEGVHPDDLERCIRTYEQAFDRREPFSMQYRLRRYDDSYHWVLDNGVPRFTETGAFVGYIGSAIDITSHKQATESLIRQRDFAEGLIATAPAIVLVLDRDGRIVRINPYMERLSGYRLEEVMGRDWFTTFLPERDRDRIRGVFQTALGGVSTRGNINPIVTKGGEERPIEWYDTILKDADGSVTGVLAIGQDITERIQAEESLRRWAHVFEHAEWGVAVSSADGTRIATLNPAFAKMHGCTVEELTGKPVVDVYAPERRADLAGHVQVAYETGHHTFESEHLRKDGTRFPVLVDVTAVKDDDGNILYRVVNVQDLSDRKKLEENARRHQEELAYVGRVSTISELAAGLAHEINQPLSAIVNYAEGCIHRLRSGNANRQPLLDAMERVGAQARRAANIIKNLREFVATRKPARSWVDINELIREAVQLVHAEAIRHRIVVKMRLGRGLPPVWANAIKIEQAIVNLLRNAIDAMRASECERREVVVRTSSMRDNHVEIAVSDTGPGLCGADAEKLFDPFYTTKTHGMGLGLAISRTIVESHGGTISVRSNPHAGVTFLITLPDKSEHQA